MSHILFLSKASISSSIAFFQTVSVEANVFGMSNESKLTINGFKIVIISCMRETITGGIEVLMYTPVFLLVGQ